MTPYLNEARVRLDKNEARVRLDKARPKLERLEVPGLPPGYLARYLVEHEAEILDLAARRLLEQDALHRALHGYVDAKKRWATLRRRGATDTELQTVLGVEIGDMHGGTLGDPTDSDWFSAHGGKHPRIELNGPLKPGRHTRKWQGKALLRAVRRHLQIGEPGPDPLPLLWWAFGDLTDEQIRAHVAAASAREAT